jgi:hypothetical protein
LNKKDLVKQWRPEMKAMGFVYRDNMFRYAATEGQPLQFGISVQKNLHDDSFKINPTIYARNPLSGTPDAQVLMGNVRPDGIYLHVFRDSWWTQATLREALAAAKKHALTWFERYGKATYLAELLAPAIHEKLGLISVIEPMDEASTTLPWAAPRTPKVGPMIGQPSCIT